MAFGRGRQSESRVRLIAMAFFLLASCDSSAGSAAGLAAAGAPAMPAAPPQTVTLPARPPAGPQQLGMNLGAATLDYDTTRLYADVMRTARDFERPAGGAVPVDEQGWPRDDFRVVVWHGIDRMHGRYTLSFQGRAQVGAEWIGAALSSPLYDAASNTTSLTLDVRDAGAAGLRLSFTDTQRTALSPPRTGVTAVKLMRPTSPGATTSEAPTALFHGPALQLHKRFRVLRFMDFLATNANQQREWRERPLPAWASYQRNVEKSGYGWQGSGGPLEHAVELANVVGADAWINLPVRASDDYVRKVALLLKHGSDGVEPYLTPTTSPRHAPLREDLKIYVEYGNELWNSAGSIFGDAFRYNQERATAEVAAGGSPLAFDGEKNRYYWGWRRVAQRTLEVSRIFREVFGDTAMMTRVRPVFMTHQGNAQEMLAQGIRLLHGYYNNGEGEHVKDPHPPSFWIYGAGGSAYYGPDDEAPGLSAETLWSSGSMDVAHWQKALARDADGAAALGVKRVAYEGGPSFDRSGRADAIKEAAARDPRVATALVEHHRAWAALGGDLLVYYKATGDHQWGFTPDVLDVDTAKLRALGQLTSLAPPLEHGAPVPGALDGGAFAYSSVEWEKARRGARDYSSAPEGFRWGSYTLRASARAPHVVALEVSGASGDATAGVYWDGILLGTVKLPRGKSRAEVARIEVEPGLHGVIVRAVSGEFTLERLTVQ